MVDLVTPSATCSSCGLTANPVWRMVLVPGVNGPVWKCFECVVRDKLREYPQFAEVMSTQTKKAKNKP